MLADGLTKALPANKWENFLNQLGLVERRQVSPRTLQVNEMESCIEEAVKADEDNTPASKRFKAEGVC